MREFIDEKVKDQYGDLFRKEMSRSSMIPSEIWDAVADRIRGMYAPKNTFLLTYGNFENSVRFIIDGIVKVTYHDNESFVYDFRNSLDFLCDTVSLFDRIPTHFSFQTITPCKWLEVPTDEFNDLVQTLDKVKISMADNLNKYLQKSQQRQAMIRNYDAEKRYRIFCTENPEIVKHAKLGDIASYLGITQQSLSRIRKSHSAHFNEQ